MKRTEAINIILNKMSGYSNKEDAAESALKELEESGILPPARGLTYEDLHAMRIVLTNVEQFKYYHTWDKE